MNYCLKKILHPPVHGSAHFVNTGQWRVQSPVPGTAEFCSTQWHGRAAATPHAALYSHPGPSLHAVFLSHVSLPPPPLWSPDFRRRPRGWHVWGSPATGAAAESKSHNCESRLWRGRESTPTRCQYQMEWNCKDWEQLGWYMYICYGSIPTFIQDLHLQIYAISATLLTFLLSAVIQGLSLAAC